MDEDISNFAAITNADPQVARGFLEMSGGNLEAAIQLFFENPDLQTGFGAAGSTSIPPAAPSSTRPTGVGNRDHPIQIDSEDEQDVSMTDNGDEDVQVTGGRGDDGDDTEEAARIARTAQEEEDAAMAQRLQQELFGGGDGGGGSGGGGSGVESVRSPIRATTETLVAPTFGGGYDEDEAAAFLQQQRQRAAARARGGLRNPFNHETSIWEDAGGGGSSGAAESNTSARARRLADLFRPPFDLMSHLDWDEARDQGKEEKKWIMVNLQDNSIFQCQALNRDLWKDKQVQEEVRENFIFLQYSKSARDAHQYITFYCQGNSHENPDNYPHVAIIDPRTGEQVKLWSGLPFPNAQDFWAELRDFLQRYSLDVSKKNPVAKETAKRPKTIDVDRMTEEEMLEMALQNSMATANGQGAGSGPTSKSSVVDPDSLTKADKEAAAMADEKEGGEGEEEQEEEEEAPSGLASIAGDKPHQEPEHDPATTTRIQFRLPTGGRVIRRFKVDETVRRIFEWLKAEPIEGKEGVEFELKTSPQGQDLLGVLEKTIQEAGLKQGTVMVEFLE
ncbi:hypothetical protein ACRALDRAFT_1074411 [Sodiomyces alcalophilus JCM 7366]|uniref:uncharacterized protein n=1 Tax=Sodiomyces alcalophilus JCM 7366 TaxID=591952 RepID=UPI0039B5E470